MARRRGATRLPRVWILIDTQTPRRPDAPSIVSDARTPPLSSQTPGRPLYRLGRISMMSTW